MSEVLVIGHRNPDTDAICSAIGYAEFKRRSGMRNVVAARCGDLNDRINFVLKSFGMPAPKFVADVSPKIRDVMQSNVISVSARTTVAEALGMMDDRNIRVLPILNEDRTWIAVRQSRCMILLGKFSTFCSQCQRQMNIVRSLPAKLLVERNLSHGRLN